MDFWKSPLANDAFELAVRRAPNDPRAAQFVAEQNRVRSLSRPQRLGEKLYELVKWMLWRCDEATRLLRVLEDWQGEEWRQKALVETPAGALSRSLLTPNPSELQPLVLGIRDDVRHVGDAKGFERELAGALRSAETVLASLEAAIEATRVRNVDAKDTLEQAFERARVNMSELAAFQILLTPAGSGRVVAGITPSAPVPNSAADRQPTETTGTVDRQATTQLPGSLTTAPPRPEELPPPQSGVTLTTFAVDRPHSTPPAVAAPSSDGSNPEGFPFVDEDITLLAELATRNALTRAADMHGMSGMPSYDRITDRLRAMERTTTPFVERPSGPRSGYRITAAGRQVLKLRGLLPT